MDMGSLDIAMFNPFLMLNAPRKILLILKAEESVAGFF
jgi:hypothetical protein